MQAVQQLNQVEITGTLDVKKESDTNINVNDNVSVIVSFMRLGKFKWFHVASNLIHINRTE